MCLMKLPSEPAKTIQLCREAGLSDRQTKIVIGRSYPQRRVIQVIREKPKTFEELAEEMHLSKEGVRYLYKNAIKKLERHVHRD